jgi:hypothetical protein
MVCWFHILVHLYACNLDKRKYHSLYLGKGNNDWIGNNDCIEKTYLNISLVVRDQAKIV